MKEVLVTELMTLEEVANYLRVTKKTIYRLLKRGGVPATKVGRQWRFEKAAIDDWLRQSSVEKAASILVIDDDETICSLFKDTLEELGHAVTTAGESSQALELVKQQDYDLVFLDLKMPGMDGAELFRRIKAVKPKLPVTIITGYPDSELMSSALAHGPFGVMKKPFRGSDILTAVDNYLRLGVSTK
jgi:excisionase family DNA binding protein